MNELNQLWFKHNGGTGIVILPPFKEIRATSTEIFTATK
jgi:hypothetical protein